MMLSGSAYPSPLLNSALAPIATLEAIDVGDDIAAGIRCNGGRPQRQRSAVLSAVLRSNADAEGGL